MTLTIRRGLWSERAKCSGEGEVMFSESPDDQRRAKEICATCPVSRQCLMAALDGDIGYGVWGGLDFEERTRVCPICRAPKKPSALGCSETHALERLARLIELQAAGDPTISVSPRARVTAPTTPGCVIPRGRSHSTAKAYRNGCRCIEARDDLRRERAARPPVTEREERTALERFMSFVETTEGDHWLWRGSTNGSGYGNFWDGQRTVRAHIFAYLELVGPIPPLMCLRPSRECASLKCTNPACHSLRPS